ncbi:MAG: acyl-CoA carboxylase subunit beta [Christensenella sp.]
MEFNLQKQHAKGKLHAYERIMALFDANSFCSMTPPDDRYDGVLCGYGLVLGKKVFCVSQDFTFKGGTLGEQHGDTIVYMLKKAIEEKCPFISINDSGGARIQEGINALAKYGEIFYYNTLASGYIPQISVIVGPCAGGAVYSPGITDFVFVVDGISQMFVTGPGVVKSVTHENVAAEELGGAKIHSSVSGVSHFLYSNENECFEGVRALIDTLPLNNSTSPYNNYVKETFKLFGKTTETESLEGIIPQQLNKAYDVKKIINRVFDVNSFIEVEALYAANIVVGFAKLSGITIGCIANQPSQMAGVLDCNTSDKAARFVRFCDAFNIPLISFTDVPGYLPGIDQERQGIIRHGAKLLYAFSEASVPRINVILRKAYGGAYIAMNSCHIGADKVFAWPSAQVAVMGAEGAVQILYAKDAAAMSQNEKKLFFKEKEDEYVRKFGNYNIALERGYIDEVIKPDDTRKHLIKVVLELENKVPKDKIVKKHGNIPL